MIFNNMYNVELTSSNYNPSADTSITITATCKDYNDNPVSGRSLTIKKNGTSIYTGTTDSNGQISTATTCGMSGAVNFSVKHFNMVINVNPYPVGSIYISYTQSQNPSALFGGTWTQITSGFLYASTTADDVTSPPSGQGAESVTLTTEQMPSHTHTQEAHTHTQNSHSHNAQSGGFLESSGAIASTDKRAMSHTSGNYYYPYSSAKNTYYRHTATGSTTATNQNATATNKNTGGGQAHNNMPPYIKVYMWKRTG